MRRRTRVSRTKASTYSPHPLINAELLFHSKCHKLQVLIDPGDDENFLDWNLAKEIGLLTEPLPTNALDRHLLCQVTHRTIPYTTEIANNHGELLSVLMCNAPYQPHHFGGA